MTRDQMIGMGLALAVGATILYVGYIWGQSRMISIYGDCLSAEAILYLAETDALDE